MKKKLKQMIVLFFKGMLMGGSDIIPGVSGGTMALITGIYEKLIHSINKIHPLKPFKTIDFKFFIPLLLGITTAVIIVATIIHNAITNFAGITYAFFFGLILASAFFVFKKLKKKNIYVLLSAIIGFVFAFLFVGLNPISSNHSLLVIFISAMLAIMAMILPGISGAFILLLLGQYNYMLNILRTMQIKEIIIFLAGAVVGIFAFSKVLDYLLEHKESVTLSFLIGLMLGALRLPYNKIIAVNRTLIFIIAPLIIGFLAVVFIEKLVEK